jgi:hypothetical protein
VENAIAEFPRDDGWLTARLGGRFIAIPTVIMLDLWLLWIPGHIYLTSKRATGPKMDRSTVILVRSLNFALGLHFFTPKSPVLMFLKWLFSGW